MFVKAELLKEAKEEEVAYFKLLHCYTIFVAMLLSLITVFVGVFDTS
jgi:hypothetical protein